MALKRKLIQKTKEFKSKKLFSKNDSIDSTMIKKMFISGKNNLQNNVDLVNQMNVFPVPDADTGSNMLATMMGGVEQIENVPSTSGCDLVLSLFARGALLGARGNSGVILSQFFNGLKVGAGSHATLNTHTWVEMLKQAKEYAYKAVLKPVEGTILTVIREGVEKLDYSHQHNTIELLQSFYTKANESLLKTPTILPILKQAKVVDAGGLGLLFVVDGMINALTNNPIKITNAQPKSHSAKRFSTIEKNQEEGEYGFCTEVIVRSFEKQSKDEIKEEITKFFDLHKTDSNILIQEEEIIKIHTHTLKPGDILNFMQKFGEIEKIKIENMTIQAEQHIYVQNESKTTPTKKRSLRNDFAVIAVSNASGVSAKFKEFGVDYILEGGQSMNPSVADFLKAFDKLDAKIVYVLPNNSNIILTAESAKKEEKMSDIHVFPTKSLTQGYASLMFINKEASIDDNEREVKNRLKKIATGSLAKSIKNVTLNKVKINENDYIVSVNEKIEASHADLFKASTNLLNKVIFKKAEIITLFIGADFDKELISKVEEYVKTKFQKEVEIIQGNQSIFNLLVLAE